MGPLVELDCFHKSHALVLKNFNFTSSITLSVENLSLDVGLVVCSGDSGAAVEAIDYDAYLATEEIVEVSVDPTVEQPVYAGFKVVEEYYSESELEDIAEQEEEEFAVSNIKLAEFEVLAEQVEQPVQSG